MPGFAQQDLQNIPCFQIDYSSSGRCWQFANLHVALLQDCLLANDVETLGSACLLHLWRVAKDDLCLWFNLSSQPPVTNAQLQFIRGQSNGQLLISVVSQRVNIKHWFQYLYPLPRYIPGKSTRHFLPLWNLSNHCTQRLSSPNRWHISQHHARVLPW